MKIEKERDVLTRAIPLLTQLYGEVTIDDSQTDRPDAAFFYSRVQTDASSLGMKRVGVEITSADRTNDLQYFNDEKMAREQTLRRIEEISNGSAKPPDGPLKKKSISFAYDYIYEGIKDKAGRHPAYVDAGDFEQIVLLFTSEFLSLDNTDFRYLARWADHLLGRSQFPFSKVIFVCKRTNNAALVFDKEKPARQRPARKLNHEQGVTNMTSQILPFGESNIGGTLVGEALLPPRKRKAK